MNDLTSRDMSVNRDIVDEMKDSYINYSMSVIVSRALPDVCLLYTSPSPRD